MQKENDIDESSKQKKALGQLLLSDDFAKLCAKSNNEFNIFKVLKLQNNEVKHSNFLGWLLTPFESHNLMDSFLKELFKVILRNNTSLVDIILKDLTDANVTLEKMTNDGRRMDIFIDSPSSKLVCVIENKIWSGEGCNQLEDYQSYILNHEKYKTYEHKLFLFLTPYEYLNCEDYKGYIRISYDDILEAINNLQNKCGCLLDDEVKIFIEHYKKMIERDIMGKVDKNIVDLCRKIYRENKEAIDLVNKNANDIGLICNLIEDIYKDDLILLKEGMFALKTFKNTTDLQCGNSKYGNNLILLQVEKINKQFYFCLNIVPAKEDFKSIRKNIINKLKIDNLINSQEDNTWCYYNVPLITEDEYFNYETLDEISNHLKEKIESIGLITKLKETFK